MTDTASRRLAVTLLAVVLAVASVAEYARWTTVQRALALVVESTGLLTRHPGIETGVRREVQRGQARLRVARALLADELDHRWLLDLDESARESERFAGLDRLRLAYDLAAESSRSRPASWEAALVLGGANFLRMTRLRDSRVASEPSSWLAQLTRARQLAPAQPEPARFLAATYLGNWSRLTPDQRSEAIDLLSAAFGDLATFDLMFERWLRVAPSLSAALSLVPDEPRYWDRVRRHYERQADWERYALATSRWSRALAGFLQAELDEAVARIAGGDVERGRLGLLSVARQTPPEDRFLPLIEELLATVPVGPTGSQVATRLYQWLEWTVDRCVHRSCPLSGAAIARLLSLTEVHDDAVRAAALMAAGDLAEAEAIERAARGSEAEIWAPYFLLKARWLLDRQQPLEASSALAQVTGHLLDSYAFQRARLAAGPETGDSTSTRQSVWEPSSWDRVAGGLRLVVVPNDPIGDLEIDLRPPPSGGSAVAVLWNGVIQTHEPVAEATTIRLPPPEGELPHLLELRSSPDGRVAPGTVRLRPREDS